MREKGEYRAKRETKKGESWGRWCECCDGERRMGCICYIAVSSRCGQMISAL